MSLTIKLQYGKHTHMVPQTVKTLEDLLKSISSTFKDKIPKNFTLKYLDDEEDQITISTQDQFSQALENTLEANKKSIKIQLEATDDDDLGFEMVNSSLIRSRILDEDDPDLRESTNDYKTTGSSSSRSNTTYNTPTPDPEELIKNEKFQSMINSAILNNMKNLGENLKPAENQTSSKQQIPQTKQNSSNQPPAAKNQQSTQQQKQSNPPPATKTQTPVTSQQAPVSEIQQTTESTNSAPQVKKGVKINDELAFEQDAEVKKPSGKDAESGILKSSSSGTTTQQSTNTSTSASTSKATQTTENKEQDTQTNKVPTQASSPVDVDQKISDIKNSIPDPSTDKSKAAQPSNDYQVRIIDQKNIEIIQDLGEQYSWNVEIQNSGESTWPQSTILLGIEGIDKDKKSYIEPLQPSQSQKVQISLVAPYDPVEVTNEWKLAYLIEGTEEYQTFGPRFTYDLKVSEQSSKAQQQKPPQQKTVQKTEHQKPTQVKEEPKVPQKTTQMKKSDIQSEPPAKKLETTNTSTKQNVPVQENKNDDDDSDYEDVKPQKKPESSSSSDSEDESSDNQQEKEKVAVKQNQEQNQEDKKSVPKPTQTKYPNDKEDSDPSTKYELNKDKDTREFQDENDPRRLGSSDNKGRKFIQKKWLTKLPNRVFSNLQVTIIPDQYYDDQDQKYGTPDDSGDDLFNHQSQESQDSQENDGFYGIDKEGNDVPKPDQQQDDDTDSDKSQDSLDQVINEVINNEDEQKQIMEEIQQNRKQKADSDEDIDVYLEQLQRGSQKFLKYKRRKFRKRFLEIHRKKEARNKRQDEIFHNQLRGLDASGKPFKRYDNEDYFSSNGMLHANPNREFRSLNMNNLSFDSFNNNNGFGNFGMNDFSSMKQEYKDPKYYNPDGTVKEQFRYKSPNLDSYKQEEEQKDDVPVNSGASYTNSYGNSASNNNYSSYQNQNQNQEEDIPIPEEPENHPQMQLIKEVKELFPDMSEETIRENISTYELWNKSAMEIMDTFFNVGVA